MSNEVITHFRNLKIDDSSHSKRITATKDEDFIARDKISLAQSYIHQSETLYITVNPENLTIEKKNTFCALIIL